MGQAPFLNGGVGGFGKQLQERTKEFMQHFGATGIHLMHDFEILFFCGFGGTDVVLCDVGMEFLFGPRFGLASCLPHLFVRPLQVLDEIAVVIIIDLFDLPVSVGDFFHPKRVQFFLTSAQILSPFSVELRNLYFEVRVEVGETVVVGLYSMKGCTWRLPLPTDVLVVLPVRLYLLLLPTQAFLRIFPVRFGVIDCEPGLLVRDCLCYLFVLQIQKHRLLQ